MVEKGGITSVASRLWKEPLYITCKAGNGLVRGCESRAYDPYFFDAINFVRTME